jgi:hypothetical protein
MDDTSTLLSRIRSIAEQAMRSAAPEPRRESSRAVAFVAAPPRHWSEVERDEDRRSGDALHGANRAEAAGGGT